MAATIKDITPNVVADHIRMKVMQLTGDNSYPTGGYSLTPALVGLKNIVFVDLASAGGHLAEYDYSAQKVKLFKNSGTPTSNPLAEVSNTTDVSTVVCRLLVIGEPL